MAISSITVVVNALLLQVPGALPARRAPLEPGR